MCVPRKEEKSLANGWVLCYNTNVIYNSMRELDGLYRGNLYAHADFKGEFIMNRYKSFGAALMFTIAALSAALPGAGGADTSYQMQVAIDLGGEGKAISPYIYGINQSGNQDNYSKFTVNAIRQGGNRFTGYNWETNASNAGADWQHSSDAHLSDSSDPADCVQTLSREATANGIGYKLATLQLAGYVAADKNGSVSETETAPSDRWNQVVLTKGSAFADTPDLTDGNVYMDEYVHYIIEKLGNSQSASGIQGYSLDNEPALWNTTHSRLHPNPVTIAELHEKSVEMAKAVKALDPDAEIFGPALYGYTAYDHLADDDSSTEWGTLQAEKGYHWYLDCYLDQMKQASDAAGTRLLDVLDIHYYSESARVGAEDRVQSVRTLYEAGFAENSWIGKWCQANVPILPTVQKSIDTYYPGTKLAISEYNYGGEDVSATIAQAEALGCYADANVYFASLWGGNEYMFSGINLYTNYDGKGGKFGDTLMPTKTADVSLASAYAAVNGTDQSVVTAMLTNKDMSRQETASIALNHSDKQYKAAAVYAVSGDSADIRLLDIVTDVSDNTVQVTLPAYSAAMIVISDDASAFDGLEIYDPSKVTERVECFEDPESMLNANGYVEIPITDPEHLKEIRMTADVTSSAGSSWAYAGCAVCINAKDAAGNEFWTSKGYQLSLGTGSKVKVEFDGTLENADKETVEAVIADGKVELQKWWDASAAKEEEKEDTITVKYTKVEVVYSVSDTPSILRGDVNSDGEVTIADVVRLCRYVAEDTELTPAMAEEQLRCADVNGDSIVDSSDITLIARYLAHLVDAL